MRLRGFTDDAVSSLRRIRRHPRDFVLLVLMLAVSIGSITGIFDVAYHALHGKLPYPRADQIAITTDDAFSNLFFAGDSFQPNPRLDTVFEKAARYDCLSANLESASGAAPQRIQFAMVTPQFFSTLGVKISVGQDFSATMQSAPYAQVPWLPIILSDQLWRSYFNRNEGILGHSIVLNISPYHFQVIGVAPPDVSFPPGADAWVPVHTVSYSTTQTAGVPPDVGGTIGLLQPALSMAAAEARIRTWPQRSFPWWYDGEPYA